MLVWGCTCPPVYFPALGAQLWTSMPWEFGCCAVQPQGATMQTNDRGMFACSKYSPVAAATAALLSFCLLLSMQVCLQRGFGDPHSGVLLFVKLNITVANADGGGGAHSQFFGDPNLWRAFRHGTVQAEGEAAHTHGAVSCLDSALERTT